MATDGMLFAGVSISSGRKPLTFAALNDMLDVVILTQYGLSEAINCLMEYERVQVAIHSSNTKSGRELFQNFENRIVEAGIQPFTVKEGPRLWIESNAEACYRAFQPQLVPQRTLEGRIQRGLILYEQGVQIPDPMDYFEEITRHKILQGVLPAENIYSSSQLAALIMAYLAWMAGSPAEKVIVQDQIMLPKITENE